MTKKVAEYVCLTRVSYVDEDGKRCRLFPDDVLSAGTLSKEVELKLIRNNNIKPVSDVSAPDEKAQKPLKAGKTVNINAATKTEIAEALSGVGPVTADAIVSYREANGDFNNLADLVNVQGVDTSMLDNNEGRIEL